MTMIMIVMIQYVQTQAQTDDTDRCVLLKHTHTKRMQTKQTNEQTNTTINKQHKHTYICIKQREKDDP